MSKIYKMLSQLYWWYLNLKIRVQHFFYNEPMPKVLETIIETTEESESSEKYDYNKYN